MNAPNQSSQIGQSSQINNNNTPVPPDQETWIQLFASRLSACWPRLDANDAEHVGDGLSREAKWRSIDPTLAAERWMAQVMGTSTTSIKTTTTQPPGAAS